MRRERSQADSMSPPNDHTRPQHITGARWVDAPPHEQTTATHCLTHILAPDRQTDMPCSDILLEEKTQACKT